MNTPTNHEPNIDLLTIKASAALTTVLRAKRQQTAPLIIHHENDLLTFDPIHWTRYARRRATGQDAQFASMGGQYLAPVYANVTGWGANNYASHLRALAQAILETHPVSAHVPKHVADKLTAMWDLIPPHIQEQAAALAMTANLDPDDVDQP